jgi:hypothetical protein
VEPRGVLRAGYSARVSADGDLSIEGLRGAVEAVESAPPGVPVRVNNRLAKAVYDKCDRLTRSAAGQVALVRAARSDPSAAVRLNAAAAVARWDPEAAAIALEALIVSAGGLAVRPMTMSAALAVDNGLGRSAALCLLNIDTGRITPIGVPNASRRPRPVVPANLLDAAERVYSLAMNGGLAHAYEVASEQFDEAAVALEAIGAGDAAAALRASPSAITASPGTDGKDRRRLDRLDERFARADVMSLLEAATEAP